MAGVGRQNEVDRMREPSFLALRLSFHAEKKLISFQKLENGGVLLGGFFFVVGNGVLLDFLNFLIIW